MRHGRNESRCPQQDQGAVRSSVLLDPYSQSTSHFVYHSTEPCQRSRKCVGFTVEWHVSKSSPTKQQQMRDVHASLRVASSIASLPFPCTAREPKSGPGLETLGCMYIRWGEKPIMGTAEPQAVIFNSSDESPRMRRAPKSCWSASSVLLIAGGRQALPHMVQLLELIETTAARDAGNTARRDRTVEQAMEEIVRALGAEPSSESYVCSPRRELLTKKRGRQPMRHTMLHLDMQQ